MLAARSQLDETIPHAELVTQQKKSLVGHRYTVLEESLQERRNRLGKYPDGTTANVEHITSLCRLGSLQEQRTGADSRVGQGGEGVSPQGVRRGRGA